jgi:hypothetical protein
MKPASLLALFLCVLQATSVAADEAQLYPLATDVELDGKVVVVDVPEGWQKQGHAVQIAWLGAAGQGGFEGFARSGKHVYDPRGAPGWFGRARVVSANVKDTELKVPTLADELDIFLAPERLLPSTVNVLRGHRLFACSWDLVLLVLWFATALALWIVKRGRFLLALAASFILAWVALDVRTMLDHVFVVQQVAQDGVPALGDAKVFADKARTLIGHRDWAFDPALNQHELIQHYFGYVLAEQPRTEPGRAEFLLALEPKQGEVVWRHCPYVLIHRETP